MSARPETDATTPQRWRDHDRFDATADRLADDVARLQAMLHSRAFCYESPGDFRAGVDALVALLTEVA